MTSFDTRVDALPALGIGVSTEYGASRGEGALDVMALRAEHPAYASFLEVGVEVARGLDEVARAWVAASRPTTYHFLDVNLDEPEDFDARWLEGVRGLVDKLRPAWLCGDAGMWHFGPRERGHMLLLPPVLSAPSADAIGVGVARLRAEVGREVLPENPPGHAFVGDMHLLDFYARVCDRADSGMLLDCAHLAIYQRMTGREPLDALDGFPLDRVVEIHVAGGTPRERDGFTWVDDDHGGAVAADTWEIFDRVLPCAPNVKAIVFECERNRVDETLPTFERLAGAWAGGT